MTAPDDGFFSGAPLLVEFQSVADAENYRPLPDDWVLATADIVDSTAAIAAGRYKSVNMAGASVISAILNALGQPDLPYVFGGDGALVAVPAASEPLTRLALSQVQAWVSDELDLTMRAAIVPLTEIRAQGLDVLVARFRASEHVSYAMFAGGGVSWAEAEMKAGRYGVTPAPPGSRPDLDGLSCRWNPIAARSGEIVSIIAVPGPAQNRQAFQALVSDIVTLVDEQGRGGRPVSSEGLAYSFPPSGLDAEARAAVPKGRRLAKKLKVMALMLLVAAADRLNFRIGTFDPKLYRDDVVQNTDFRKFDDGLKMTIDVKPELRERLETLLAQAEAAGVCHYGVHRQDSALMTCMVVNPMQRDHVHFVDGAAGGYAMAAANMKAKTAAQRGGGADHALAGRSNRQ